MPPGLVKKDCARELMENVEKPRPPPSERRPNDRAKLPPYVAMSTSIRPVKGAIRDTSPDGRLTNGPLDSIRFTRFIN
jgi:hypothetical protein